MAHHIIVRTATHLQDVGDAMLLQQLLVELCAD
jgi:predicted ATPase